MPKLIKPTSMLLLPNASQSSDPIPIPKANPIVRILTFEAVAANISLPYIGINVR